MHKKRLFVLILILSRIFSAAFSFDDNLQKKFVEFFYDSERFHDSVLNKFESEIHLRPICFVLTYETKENFIEMRKFFDVNDYSESEFEYSEVLVTVPYYSFTSDINDSKIHFSFAFPKSEMHNFTIINDKIASLYLNGKIDEFAKSYGIYKKVKFFHPKRKIDKRITNENILITFLTILNVVVMLIYVIKTVQKQREKTQKEPPNSLYYHELAVEQAEKAREKITDNVTGLFTIDYLKSRIQEEITRYQFLQKPFCLAIFTVHKTASFTTLRKTAKIIMENLSKDVTSAYKENGIYVSLFTEKKSDDIAIFVDLTTEKLEDEEISVESQIYEFHGQKNFMESIGI